MFGVRISGPCNEPCLIDPLIQTLVAPKSNNIHGVLQKIILADKFIIVPKELEGLKL